MITPGYPNRRFKCVGPLATRWRSQSRPSDDQVGESAKPARSGSSLLARPRRVRDRHQLRDRRETRYGAFGSKHGLYLAVLDQYTDRNVGATRQALAASDAAPVDELREYLDGIAVDSSDGSPSCLFTGATAELCGHDEPVAQRVHAAFDDISATLRAAVERGQADGTIATGIDPQTAADLLLAVARGIEVLGHAGISRERLTSATEAGLAALTR